MPSNTHPSFTAPMQGFPAESLPAGSRFTGMPCQRLTNTLAPLVRREP